MSSLGSNGVLKGSVGRLVGFLVDEAPARLPCRSVEVLGVLEDRRGLKEAAQAERREEGLSGGRCSVTNRTTPPTSHSTPVPSTNWSAEIPAEWPVNRCLFPASLFSLPFFCLPLSKHLIRLISSTRPKLQPSPLNPGFFSPSRLCAVPTGPPGSGL